MDYVRDLVKKPQHVVDSVFENVRQTPIVSVRGNGVYAMDCVAGVAFDQVSSLLSTYDPGCYIV